MTVGIIIFLIIIIFGAFYASKDIKGGGMQIGFIIFALLLGQARSDVE